MRILSLSPKSVAFCYRLPISGTCSILSSLLHPAAIYAILKTQREQPPKWLTSKVKLEIHRIATLSRPKFGVVFLCLKHYLINVKTNVSNARMNIPKAIKSLKSKGFLSISTTPILCRIEASHPATRLFHVW